MIGHHFSASETWRLSRPSNRDSPMRIVRGPQITATARMSVLGTERDRSSTLQGWALAARVKRALMTARVASVGDVSFGPGVHSRLIADSRPAVNVTSPTNPNGGPFVLVTLHLSEVSTLSTR